MMNLIVKRLFNSKLIIGNGDGDDEVIYMSAALLSPKFKYFNYATETEEENFIKFGETNIKKFGMI